MGHERAAVRHRARGIAWSAWAVPAIFVASMLITLLFWLVLPARFDINESSDYLDFYEPVARNILDGRGITLADAPATRTPPGYPLLLAGLFGLSDLLTLREETVVSAFILVCTGLSSVFLLVLARSVWSPWTALLSSLVWMTYPFALWLTKQPNSETPFLVIFYAAFTLCWYALRAPQPPRSLFFASGLLFGLAMLIRPIAVGLGFVTCVIIWLTRRDLRSELRLACIGAVLLGNIVAVLPWELWIYARTGRPILLSTSDASSIRDGLTFTVELRGYRGRGGVPHDVQDLMRDLSARRDEMQSLSGILAVLGDEAQRRPLATAQLLAVKVIRSWYGTDSRRFEVAILLLQIPYLLSVLWATRMAWRLGGTPRTLATSIWIVVFYFWAMTIMVVPVLRYMMPVMGLVFVLLPAGVPTLSLAHQRQR